METLISQVFGIATDTVRDELGFDSIDSWDSLTHMQLITALEDRYKIQFTGDEIADMRSVGAARAALRAHGLAV
ncbi:acyl carrier protein [Roseateles sp.]|jgi:acyl carrier protein|uniref:acyl carrier protein n=1 Tax=Roseateles sp. TaxID=1971397 RepID=UPI0037C9CBC7